MFPPRHIGIRIVFGSLLILNGCSEDFLEVAPVGDPNEVMLAYYEGVDALLIGAYSMLDGVSSNFGWEAATSGWLYGSIRGLEANKGSDSGDSNEITPVSNFYESATNSYLNNKWKSLYEAIARCNSTLIVALNAFEAGTITEEQYLWFTRQARALRGFYHFEAWRMWADTQYNLFVPYVDEHANLNRLTNMQDIRSRIIDDLAAGTELPLNMRQVGRFNRTVSQVFLAKAYMQMYLDYGSALPLLTEAEQGGTNPVGQQAGLEPCYGDIFDIEFRNGIESIYTVQYSVNDGSGGYNGGYGEVLNFPYKSGASPGGCCGFFQPTQDFVNSFRTDPDGLPYLDSYNDELVTNDLGLPPIKPWDAETVYAAGVKVTASDPGNPLKAQRHYTSLLANNTGNDPLTSPGQWQFDTIYTEYAGQLDPRLDWSVGRCGIPYWDWGDHTGRDWIRDQYFGGPYSPKKQVYKKSQEGIYTEVGSWTSGYTANGYRMIRYADVLLLKAECEARTWTDDLGLGEVNRVRARAANPEGFVMEADGTTPAAHYVIGLYPAFPDALYAMKAIKFERKLELGQEGHRYYDLQRWREVVSELTRILEYEKTMPWAGLQHGYAEVGPEDVNYPIPQRQIDLSHGWLHQNR